MKLEQMKMENWFIETTSCKYNFSESGVPDFTLNEFFKKIKVNKSVLNNIYLGNNSTWGSLKLRKSICKTYQTIKPENLIITNGTSEALYILFNLFLNKRSKVFILFPAFPPLYLIPRAFGAKVYLFDVLKPRNKSEMMDRLIYQIKKNRPNLLIINTPHNPTGFIFNKEDIKKIGLIARKTKTFILFDEHYRFLPINNSEKILPSGYDIVSRFYDKVLAVGSMIKCAGIVGLRIGWLIADKTTLNKLRDYKDYTTHCAPLITETIASLAIKNINKITGNYIKRIEKNWFILQNSQLVKNKKIILNYELKGGCVYFPKINNFNTVKLAQILADKYNVSVMPGEVFDKKGYLRINLSQKIKYFKYLLKCLNLLIK